MNAKSHLPTVLAFCVLSLILIVMLTMAHTAETARRQASIMMLGTNLGGLIAFLSAALLLFRAAGGASMDALMPLILPLLAGMLMMHYHWSIAVILGALGITLLIRQMTGTPEQRKAPQASGDTPPLKK